MTKDDGTRSLLFRLTKSERDKLKEICLEGGRTMQITLETLVQHLITGRYDPWFIPKAPASLKLKTSSEEAMWSALARISNISGDIMLLVRHDPKEYEASMKRIETIIEQTYRQMLKEG